MPQRQATEQHTPDYLPIRAGETKSCRQCDPCKQGLEQYCEAGHTLTYASHDRHDQRPTYGGYSEKIVASEKFVAKVPDGLDLAGAAPLLCAGITMWSPLRYWKVGKGSKVAITGLGGLGHMGFKLARALGAEVTLFTRSPGKEQDARRLEADHIVLSTDEAQMATVKGRFDLVIDTVPCVHDVNPYLPTLKLNFGCRCHQYSRHRCRLPAHAEE